ncbi:hypothetical protein GY45DRAFT_118597 [Cubamyces sp. BRFM 1775]|nr:hypothetical protein GY45DRAFT_118597 [Cubamyces sp. BRFM 1775]
MTGKPTCATSLFVGASLVSLVVRCYHRKQRLIYASGSCRLWQELSISVVGEFGRLAYTSLLLSFAIYSPGCAPRAHGSQALFDKTNPPRHLENLRRLLLAVVVVEFRLRCWRS